MITPVSNKVYNHQGLELCQTETERYYLLDGKTKLPSVSTVLRATESPEDKERLRKWQHKMDKIYGIGASDIQRDGALKRGTDFHFLVESYWENRTLSMLHQNNPFFMSAYPFLRGIRDQDIYLYESMFCCDRYAGRLDFLGSLYGRNTVVDFTTSNRRKRKEWLGYKFLQASAYASLVNQAPLDITVDTVAVIVAQDNDYQIFISELGEYLPIWFQRLTSYESMLKSGLI